MSTNAFSWGSTALPAVQKSLNFTAPVDTALNFSRTTGDMEITQDFHFKAIAQDFHRSALADAPELALPAVQADTADL